MKKSIFIATFLLINLGCFSQSKKELLAEIAAFEQQFISNKKFDTSRTNLFEAIIAVGSQRHSIKRESEKRGFVDFYYENDLSRYTLTVEIISEEQPFQIILSINAENRSIDFTTNSYTAWQKNYNINQRFTQNFKLQVYEKLFGPIAYPDDLLSKIELLNSKQKKDKNRIIKGIDF